jgi:DNA invertase Pin-like site-specific DNA recombinase
MARAFLYGRHSTDKQDLTQEVQLDICQRYYERELLPKGVELAGWFYDEAITSAILFGEREQGRIVVASLQPGDHLVVAKMSRPFRSVRDGENTLHQLSLRRVTLHALDMPIDTTRAHGRFVRRVHMAADQLWREVSSEAVRETIAYRKSLGLPFSRGVPVGWKAVGRRPHRVYRADPQERVLAEHISKLHAAGMSMERIALWSYTQKQFPNKRQFRSREAVRWALNAHALGYPKVTGYKEVRKLVRSGKV